MSTPTKGEETHVYPRVISEEEELLGQELTENTYHQPKLYRWRVAFLFVFSIALYLFIQTLFSTPLFNLKEFKLEGAVHLTLDEVQRALKIDKGAPLLGLDMELLSTRVRENPWVREVELSRALPSTLVIRVREHQLTGVALLDGFWGLNEKGVPFTPLSVQKIAGLPLITGLTRELFNVEPEVGRRLFSRALELSRLYQDHPFSIGQRLSNLHITPVGRLELLLERTRVSLGKDRLGERLERAGRLLVHLDQEGREPEYLILSDDLNRVLVKEAPPMESDSPAQEGGRR
ncbi:MAG: FtsQ-type POTRA domain-containing protein [Myxococcota bacterium]|nr:FtsQ-type POTRA domain-containing protein [Myxococcota bacterium]